MGSTASKPTVALVGAGRLGTALGILLARSGYPIGGVVCRSPARAREAVALIGAGTPHTDPAAGAQGAGVIIISVPDRALAGVARAIAAGCRLARGVLLAHTSGAHSAAVLRVPGTEGARLLSLHPIQTVADPRRGAERLRGAAFGIEGDEEALDLGEALVRDLGGVPLRIKPGRKALYHAAACVASNYLVALVDAALALYRLAGIEEEAALRALRPLMEGAIENAARLGPARALTGPIERGDVETVQAHLAALAAAGADRARLEGLYRTLGLSALALVARRDGALSPAHQALGALLQGGTGPHGPPEPPRPGPGAPGRRSDVSA